MNLIAQVSFKKDIFLQNKKKEKTLKKVLSVFIYNVSICLYVIIEYI